MNLLCGYTISILIYKDSEPRKFRVFERKFLCQTVLLVNSSITGEAHVTPLVIEKDLIFLLTNDKE